MVYRFKDNVRFLETEKDAYLEIIETGERITVGGAAINFIKQIDGTKDLDEILESLMGIYGPNVEPYILAKDLESFIFELFEWNLIEVVSR